VFTDNDLNCSDSNSMTIKTINEWFCG